MWKTSSQSMYKRFAAKLVTVLVLVSFVVFLISHSNTKTEILSRQQKRHYSVKYSATARTNRTQVILAWTKIFSKDFHIFDNHRALPSKEGFATCPGHRDCEWTTDRSRIKDADAVLFHFFPDNFKLKDLPSTRYSDQQWVYMSLESPIRFKEGKVSKVDDMFDILATYEDDADVSLPYGTYYPRNTPLKNYLPPAHNRSKPIVWMASRCHTLSRREVYVTDLQNHIDVEVFGDCGKPAPMKGSPPINLDFRTELAKKYYFYLAFENSNCIDYITEKFWTALKSGLVPIVRGQLPRYEKHVPPGSYINADAFFSYKDLADYLKHLIAHPEEYNRYFLWRQKYEVKIYSTFINLDIHCKLCDYLHTQQRHQTPYKLSHRFSKRERCFDYHHNLPQIDFEVHKAYDDEFKDFLE